MKESVKNNPTYSIISTIKKSCIEKLEHSKQQQNDNPLGKDSETTIQNSFYAGVEMAYQNVIDMINLIEEA